MGKGDIKTRRGKFFAGSFGKRRPRKKNKPLGVSRTVEEPNEMKTVTTAPEKEPEEQKKSSPATNRTKKPEEKPKVKKTGGENP